MANEGATRLPFHHPRRVELHDSKLWRRERRRAHLQRLEKLKCPCTSCKGNKLILVSNIEKHLIKNGRMPLCRWWRDREFEWDDSDEEWCAHFEAEVGGVAEQARSAEVEEPRVVMNEMQDEASADPPVFGDNEEHDMSLDHDVDPPDIDVNRMLAEMFHDFDELQADHGHVPRTAEEELNDREEDLCDQARLEKHEASLREACKPLYAGARMSVLSFVMMLLNICYQHGVPNIAVDEILALLKQKAFPVVNDLPAKHYNAKRLVSKLGLDYVSFHACSSGCILFRGEFADLSTCPKCGGERYLDSARGSQPVKVLRHFPIIPRLLRMYRAKSMSDLLKWAGQNKSRDGLVRHAADSQAWKHIDTLYPDFAEEERNLRFGIALDGVNPYSDKSTSWSTWPVLLINYNLPPWLCTKKFFLQLALLIPGKESVTGDNLDVYLAPLVEELQRLWVGVSAFDASSPVDKQHFKMRGMLIWSVNDYPALGTLSGRSSKGLLSCVVCGPRVTSDYSKPLHKPIFQGHRKWLSIDHPYRRASYGHHFNNRRERGHAPKRVTSAEVLEWASLKKEYDDAGGQADGLRDPYKRYGVKRRSVLFDLPYWQHLLIRETVDVMHTEKNVAEHLLRTILGELDKPKVRRDMEDRNIGRHLWLTPHRTRANIWVKPIAPWVLTKPEQKIFKARLAALKVPTGYCGRLQKHILEKKIGHMKSHDFHVFIHQIMPVCLRGLMRSDVRSVIMRLSRLFRKLCVKVWDPQDLASLQEEAAVTLVLLEMQFPPSFFNNMTHLIVHLVEELGICGPVACRWMYPIERYLSVMKRYVRNRARPEGCMAECYLQDEAVGFATEYMANFDPVRTRIWDDKEDLSINGEMLEGANRPMKLSVHLRNTAHLYVLMNMECMGPWVKKWEEEQGSLLEAGRAGEPLPVWLQNYMRNHVGLESFDSLVAALAMPPSLKCKSYKGMRAYGNHYRVVEEDSGQEGRESKKFKTFDSGIASVFNHPPAENDRNSPVCKFSYVGTLVNILQLDYGLGEDDPILLQGSWVRNDWEGRAPTMKWDDSGFLLANFRRLLPESREPFVFPSQVEQVFFAPVDLEDPLGWCVVLRKEARSRRIMDEAADMLRDDNVFSALQAPLVLPTELPELDPDGELLDTEELIFRAASSNADDMVEEEDSERESSSSEE